MNHSRSSSESWNDFFIENFSGRLFVNDKRRF